jgi:hydrogenase maturation protein HypF
MLFDRVDDPAFVMTSANPPNEPIVKNNDEALKTLGGIVDYFLFHDRKIANRCDDSVMRVHNEAQVLVRRSRGYAPAPVMLNCDSKKCVVALGGELNNTSCVLLGKKAFLSQHIGDVENVETRDFLEKATMHLIHLTNSKVDAVACDLHPKFTTTKLATRLSQQNGWQLFQVQHHYAHVNGLMVEHGLKEILGICCDGYGYGEAGEAWGGEVLYCAQGSFGKRVAHLEKQPFPGGDLATHHPLRIAAGILSKCVDIGDWLLLNEKHFRYGKEEIEVLQRQLETGNGVIDTTSCGRVLDAAAAVLGICYERTYEGEPAIKLESVATKGKDVLALEPIIRGNVLDTTRLLVEVFGAKNRFSKPDLAYSVHAYLAKGLAVLATQKAAENGVKKIGFCGGVATNRILRSIMCETVRAMGMEFLVHEAVPAGDGGLSFGQAVSIGFS